MGKPPKDLPATAEGHLERLRRVERLTERIFASRAAQATDAPTLGTELTALVHLETGAVTPQLTLSDDPESVAHLAVLLRPFTLDSESVHYKKVATALRFFAATKLQQDMADQLVRLWEWTDQPRMYLIDKHGQLPDRDIADRALYAEIVHADDAEDLLGRVNTDLKRWALASVTGDWLAIVAHQQDLVRRIRPDVCSELVGWKGDSTTIFTRLGAAVEYFDADPGVPPDAPVT